MVDPALALGVFTIVSAVLLVFLWPERGLWWRWRELTGLQESVLVEDTLKHLYKSEYEGREATLESLAGVLEISRDRAAELLERCRGLGVLELRQDQPVLTPEGRLQALHVIRVHRLWECYLAERTGVNPLDWHREAEVREHLLTPAETDELAARLNHPSHDPHGDPIPTSDGRMPPPKGLALSQVESGAVARILHVEDEPAAVYAQIVALDLRPGTIIHVLDSTPEKIVVSAHGSDAILAPLVAANVTVQVFSKKHELEPEPIWRTLASLEPGQSAEVRRLASSCRGLERERLLDLGLVPGTSVTAQMRGPLGDPVAYRVRGATVALRREQAERVLLTESVESECETV